MTLRDLLTEEDSKELISAGTGKKIKYFTKDNLYPGSGETQIVQTEDGNFDFYVSDVKGAFDIYKKPKYFIGTLENKYGDNDTRHIYEIYKTFIDSPKISDKMRDIIRQDVNHKLNLDRYEKDKDGKRWLKEI